MIGALALALVALAPLPQQPDSARRLPAIVARARLDPRMPVNFRVLVVPETVYVGQQATYQLAAFVDFAVRDRLRRMEVPEPDLRGVMAYDAPASARNYPTRLAGSHRYEVHVSERPIFPLSPGRIAIAPAQLVYALPLSYSFFSREETYELRSDSAVLVALAPPAAGRPADWTGAVGALRVTVRLDTATATVGAPVTLTIRVTGRGNVKLFPRPRLELSWAQVVPEAERVELSADSLDIHGAKEFDWLVTPTRPGRFVIPAVRYPYFDPAARRYDVSLTEPLALNVRPGVLVADSGAPAQPRWAVRASYRGPLPVPLWSSSGFWWIMLLAPIPAAALGAVRLRRRLRRVPRLPSPGRALHEMARRSAVDVRAVRRAFLAAVAQRVGVAATELAEPGVLARAARRAGTSRATAAAAEALMLELNAAAFDRDPASALDAAGRADRIFRAIDAEARRPGRRARASALLLVLGAFATAPLLHAALPDADTLQFARGLQEYDRQQYTQAERDFLALATREPRAADAWANMGTAAFAASDTARAVVGWQRALRLEPRAPDLRARLAWLDAGPDSGVGAVPEFPVAPLALMAALLWLAGWLAAAVSTRRGATRRRLARSGALLAAALAIAAGAVALDRALAAANLGVTTSTVALHDLPDMSAEPHATLRTGEVVRVLERDGVWMRVAADGGRAGWMATTSFTSIARD